MCGEAVEHLVGFSCVYRGCTDGVECGVRASGRLLLCMQGVYKRCGV